MKSKTCKIVIWSIFIAFILFAGSSYWWMEPFALLPQSARLACASVFVLTFVTAIIFMVEVE